MTSFIIYALKQVWGYLCDKINVDEIGVACDTYGNDENLIQFWLENMNENDSLDHLNVVWRITLKCIVQK
jgi:hypothetical protein